MPVATFRNATIRPSTIVPKEGGPVLRIKITADYSTKVQEDLETEPLPEKSPNMGLDVELIGGQTITLTPNGDLKMHEMQMACISAEKFKVSRVKEGEDATTDKLSFEVLTNDEEACSKLWGYLKVVGEAPGVLKVRYSEQVTTDEVTEEPEEPQQSLDKSVISFDAPAKSPIESKRRSRAEVQ